MPNASADPDAFSALLTTYDLPELQEQTFALSALLELDLKPQLASRLRQAYITLINELKEISRQVAALAHDEILDAEVSTRVRPDTGGDGGARLEDFIGQSFPLDAVPGSVGINFEPPLYDNVPWWWTNEEGYSGHIGRVVHGFFYDAGFTNASAASGSRSREHPLFDPGPPPEGGKGGAEMIIQNPIPERRFVEHGYAAAAAAWHARVDAARARFDQKVSQVLSTMRAGRSKRP